MWWGPLVPLNPVLAVPVISSKNCVNCDASYANFKVGVKTFLLCYRTVLQEMIEGKAVTGVIFKKSGIVEMVRLYCITLYNFRFLVI